MGAGIDDVVLSDPAANMSAASEQAAPASSLSPEKRMKGRIPNASRQTRRSSADVLRRAAEPMAEAERTGGATGEKYRSQRATHSACSARHSPASEPATSRP